MQNRPLAGVRVVVTRAAEQAEATADLLRSVGAQPIILPMIQFVVQESAREQLRSAMAKFETYDWLIFTSQNGVRFFDQLMCENFPRKAGYSYSTLPRIAVSGTRTAALAERLGMRVDLIPEKFVGESLVVALGDVLGQRILFPRAKKGRVEIVEMLRERGAIVDEIALYDTVSADPTPAARAELANGFDVILFTSPTTVENFAAQFADDNTLSLETVIVGCIGEVTKKSAEAHDFTVHITPEESTMNGLITALTEYYQTRCL